MRGLKDLVDSALRGGPPSPPPPDPVLEEIRGIVGAPWATSDPAVTVTYSHDPCALSERKMPRLVVLPGSREEVAAVFKCLDRHGVAHVIRGNGSSVIGLVLSEGAGIDVNRMRSVEFDEANWLVKVGPGVTAFDLQRAAVARGYRVNAAEPAALVCGNIMCSSLFSLFSASYGTGASNVVDAEFVGADGVCFALSDAHAPNLLAFRRGEPPFSGICTSASVRLHRLPADETAVIVPFDSLGKALALTADLAARRIGVGLGILGTEYMSAFMAPTREVAQLARDVLGTGLGIRYAVTVIGDRDAIAAVERTGHPVIDQRLFRQLHLALPRLGDSGWLELLEDQPDAEPFSYLKARGFHELVEAALSPSPGLYASAVDPDMRGLFERLYARPEMTDIAWLNTFRILSTRMGRDKNFMILILYLPVDAAVVDRATAELKAIADRHGLKNDFGFLLPLDDGKRCLLEYDYYSDQNDPEEQGRMRAAFGEALAAIGAASAGNRAIQWIGPVLGHGISRQESLLYGQPS